jgi:riboflavin synthase
MFTGLIIELGRVASLDKKSDSARLSIKSREVIKDATIGDSIAINGVCLTVTELRSSSYELFFDVSYETLQNTNIGSLKKDDRVNLEPSLRPVSRLGGHFVTGHVEGIGKIRKKTQIANALKIEIEAPDNILQYLVEKGSVAIDGISLTVVNVLNDAFSVVIIPHTAKMTTIGFKNIGATVNLEPDILGKYVAKFLSARNAHKSQSENKDAALLSALQSSGFIDS